MKFERVEGYEGLVKDERGVFHNINKQEINQARKKKQARLEKEKKDEALEKDVNLLKDEISEIKALLKKLVEE